MRIKAALYNADHLEYGLVTIPFPIPQDQYNDTIKMLEALDIRQQIMQNLDGTVTGLSCWAAELEDLQETPAQRETQPEASEQTKADSISLSM